MVGSTKKNVHCGMVEFHSEARPGCLFESWFLLFSFLLYDTLYTGVLMCEGSLTVIFFSRGHQWSE
jgi:hypothetical protein